MKAALDSVAAVERTVDVGNDPRGAAQTCGVPARRSVGAWPVVRRVVGASCALVGVLARQPGSRGPSRKLSFRGSRPAITSACTRRPSRLRRGGTKGELSAFLAF